MPDDGKMRDHNSAREPSEKEMYKMLLSATSKIQHKIRCTRKQTLNLSVKAKIQHVNL